MFTLITIWSVCLMVVSSLSVGMTTDHAHLVSWSRRMSSSFSMTTRSSAKSWNMVNIISMYIHHEPLKFQLRIEVQFFCFHSEIKCKGSLVNLWNCLVLLKDLRLACCILFPNEDEKILYFYPCIYTAIKLPLRSLFVATFISLNPLPPN